MKIQQKIHKITIIGRIPSKKNGKVWTGKYLVSSASHTKWELQASHQIEDFANLFIESAEIQIDFYWPDLRNADLTNKAESVMDLLVKMNTIEDDNWKIISDIQLRSCGLDRKNPRAEIWIKEKENGK